MAQVVTINQSLNEKNSSSFFTEEQISIIRGIVAKNLTDVEFNMFLYICMRHNLDPVARQIYAVKRGSQMTIQTGIDGFRLIAERTGKYSPGRASEFQYTQEGKLLSATVFVKKLTADTWHEVSATAFLSEYIVPNNPLWAKMPHVMLEKCAEAKALRRAFPSDLSGLYTDDEMSQADTKEIENESQFISEDQVSDLENLLENHEELKERMLKFCEVSSLEKIKAKQFNTCINTIKKYQSKEKA